MCVSVTRERGAREEPRRRKKNSKRAKEVYTADSRSCSIYKNSKTFAARVHVCVFLRAPFVCLRVYLSAEAPRARVEINKTHTIEGFLLFGSRGRGSYFVVR